MSDIEVLARARALFDGDPDGPALGIPGAAPAGETPQSGAMAAAYRRTASAWLSELHEARRVDTRLAQILADARRDHADARRSTGAVLAAARAEAASHPGNPVAARELMRRRAQRLRIQHSLVRTARMRARQHRSALHSLQYGRHRAGPHDGRTQAAVRAALSRLGRPYVWGATGPDRFDCSGLVQWAYAQAGVRLHRTTYEQIHDGVPVAPSQVRPGDLVFPHTGHVQLAIGDGMVVEAPQPGAVVQVSRMGPSVAIRRPLG